VKEKRKCKWNSANHLHECGYTAVPLSVDGLELIVGVALVRLRQVKTNSTHQQSISVWQPGDSAYMGCTHTSCLSRHQGQLYTFSLAPSISFTVPPSPAPLMMQAWREWPMMRRSEMPCVRRYMVQTGCLCLALFGWCIP
jgi:hypothetical protein